MSRRRPETLADLNVICTQHDEVVSREAPDSLAVILATTMLSAAVNAWRAARAIRAATRVRWETANDALHAADKAADDEARRAWLRAQANLGPEGVARLEALANHHRLGELVKMPIDRALVVYADFFAAVDAAGDSLKLPELDDLRASVAALGAAHAEESTAKAAWIAAGPEVDAATATLQAAASRYALALESAIGPDAAARLFPPLPDRRAKAEDAGETS